MAKTEVEVPGVERETQPADIAMLLKMEPQAKGVHALRLRRIRGTPVMLPMPGSR